jgi:hypothetical protein
VNQTPINRRAFSTLTASEVTTLILMNHLPLGGVVNLATKDDLKLLGAELRADIEERMNRQTITMIGTMTGIMGLMLAIMKWA